METSRGVWIND